MYSLMLALIFLSFCGCTTVEFVRKDLAPEKKATLRYQSSKNADKEVKLRNEIQKKAREFCGGAFEITKEYQARQNTGASTGIGTGLGIGMGGIMVGASNDTSAMYNMVEVSCRAPGGETPSDSKIQ